MKRLFIFLMFSLYAFACNAMPSQVDLTTSLKEMVVSQCSFASISDIRIKKITDIDPRNRNIVNVEYSYYLTIKGNSEYKKAVDDWKKYKKEEFPKLPSGCIQYHEGSPYNDVRKYEVMNRSIGRYNPNSYIRGVTIEVKDQRKMVNSNKGWRFN